MNNWSDEEKKAFQELILLISNPKMNIIQTMFFHLLARFQLFEI